MNRSPMPSRRRPMNPGKPLDPGGPLPRHTGLPQRKAPMSRSAPARTPHPPKPRPRPVVTSDERAARDVLRERSGGVCEGCGRARAADFSHRVGEGVGGPWCPSNGLHLCRVGCHGWIHANPGAARLERGWRLESHEDPAAIPALHWFHGWVLLGPDGSFCTSGPPKF